MPLILPVVSLGLIVLGVLVNYWAIEIGVATVQWDASAFGEGMPAAKEVGFLAAPNWGLSAVLFMPAAIFIMIQGIMAFSLLIRSLTHRGMLRLANGDKVTPQHKSIRKLKKNTYLVAAGLSLLIGVAVIFVVYRDYSGVTGNFLAMDPPQCRAELTTTAHGMEHAKFERDWSVAACILPPGQVVHAANSVFALVVHLIYPGVLTSLIIGGFVFAFVAALQFGQGALRHYGLQVVPDLASTDSRRGFETAEDILSKFCILGALALFILYCMVLQNVYLRTSHSSLFDFIFAGYSEVVAFFGHVTNGKFIDAVLALAGPIFAGRYSPSIAQSAYGVLLGGAVIFLLYFAGIWSLHGSITAACTNVRAQINSGSGQVEQWFKLTKGQALRRINSITLWPIKMKWLSFGWLAGSAIFGFVSLIAINMGLIFFMILFVAGLAFAARQILATAGLLPAPSPPGNADDGDGPSGQGAAREDIAVAPNEGAPKG